MGAGEVCDALGVTPNPKEARPGVGRRRHSGLEVPKGYWLVPAKWYKLVQTSQRAYVLLKDEMQLNVNSMLRLPEPIEFQHVKARKKPSTVPNRSSSRLQSQPPLPPPPPSQQREKPRLLGEPKHNEILESLADVRLCT